MQYRREIDGLRAVAILPVILFHAGFGVFSGGYIGVDVFFVISGYLITSNLISELTKGDFSIVRFYERRARRILPALFFVLLVCLPFAYLLMLPSQFADFAQSMVAAVFFASNVLFWREDGYFAAASELKPLLHTWSLAVEEQYYVLFPIFLLMVWRFGRQRSFFSVCFIAVLSLLLAEWGWRAVPKASFYLAPTRVWELLAGSISAFMTVGRPQRSNTVISALGLALILFAIFAFDKTTPFTSLYAVVPVMGAMLVILFAAPGTWVARLLGLPGCVGVGLISYSAYLWHQPLFAFARLYGLREPSQTGMAALVVVTLLLAWATWFWVEQAFRKGANPWLASRRSLFAASAAIGGACVAVGLTADNTGYFYSQFSNQKTSVIAYLEYDKSAEFNALYRMPDCFYSSTKNDFSVYNKERCLHLSAVKKNYLLMGDSHAAHLWKALSQAYPQYNLMQATASGCRPLLPLQGEKRCTDLIDYITSQWLMPQKLDAIILSARWKSDDAARMAHTIATLQGYAHQIIVLGPTVEYEHPLPLLLAKNDIIDARSAQLRKFVLHERFLTEETLRISVEQAGARFVKVASHICNDIDCMAYVSGQIPIAWDYGHFTAQGAAYVVKMLDPLGQQGP